jgi:very-short-patch-repair endonuclease
VTKTLGKVPREPYGRFELMLLCFVPFLDFYYAHKFGKLVKFTILTFILVVSLMIISLVYGAGLAIAISLIAKIIQLGFMYNWTTQYNLRISGYKSRSKWKNDNFDSDFEIQVYKRLMSRGYIVHSQIKHSRFRVDLAIVNPNDPKKYILGIECDGAMYHSTDEQVERDWWRQDILESQGWIIERIWSKDWWRNSSYEVERIDQRVKDLMRMGGGCNVSSLF